MIETGGNLDGLENREAPPAVGTLPTPAESLSSLFVSRREFMEWMTAVGSVMGLSACTRQPVEKIYPYAKAPEHVIPGKPLFFATAVSPWGMASGVLVESHMGRPTKIEGNPDHPASLGATDRYAQATILDLYDPERSKAPSYRGVLSTWNQFLRHMAEVLDAQLKKQGAGLRILSESIYSPTLDSQRKELLKRFPRAKWIEQDSLSPDHRNQGTRLAFGEPLDARYDIAAADVIVAVDSNFLCDGAANVRYAREFSRRRRMLQGMNRLYVLEGSPTNTGAMADHRFSLSPAEIQKFVLALAEAFGVIEAKGVRFDAAWFDPLVQDLKRNQGKCLIAIGESLPPAVQALLHGVNEKLGNNGKTVFFQIPLVVPQETQAAELQGLIKDMNDGRVDVLISLGGNPAYSIPKDSGFLTALNRVKVTVHSTVFVDETSQVCHWALPENHCLEHWSDREAFDGTISIVQPLIAPMYGGRSQHELVSILLGRTNETGYDAVQSYWKKRLGDKSWRKVVHDGVVPGTQKAVKRVSLKSLSKVADLVRQPWPQKNGEYFLSIRPDPTILDGRFSQNGWLQELPKPLTKLTWENVALMSPAAAKLKGLENGALVSLNIAGKGVEAAVWTLPGQHDSVVTVHLGYGRTQTGRLAKHKGFSAELLRGWDYYWDAPGLSITPKKAQSKVACTQTHFKMEGRDLVREATISAFQQDPHLFQKHHHGDPKFSASISDRPSLQERPFEDANYAWGMVFDLSACNGCNACVVACQSENNIPVVGKEEVLREREMHWIRIDRYFAGDEKHPNVIFQPVNCMHCESAPCEVVCPVNATSHSPEGLNEMTYNRCVGTKYCSNNCPYKVRRFNFFPYADQTTASLKLMNNPDVTVRSRGVMEKCTYCVQRINATRIEAKKSDRLIGPDEMVTACQAACPSEAIQFGNVKDPKSRVSELKRSPLNYGLLEELNTRPRTTYLARLSNPNLAISGGSTEAEAHGH